MGGIANERILRLLVNLYSSSIRNDFYIVMHTRNYLAAKAVLLFDTLDFPFVLNLFSAEVNPMPVPTKGVKR